MSHALVFVESNSTGTGRLMAAAAARLGFVPVVLASEPSRYAYVAQDGLEVRVVDTQREADVLAACRALAAERGVAGVTSSSEYFVGTAAAVAAELGLRAPPAAAIRACSDKARQRQLLDEGRVTQPRWWRVASAVEALSAAAELRYPVVLKPVAGSGSIGVRMCKDAAEVERHAPSLVQRTVNERGMKVPLGLLVEELVEGPELSVEVFSSQVVGVTAKRLGPLPDFVEIGHDFQAELPTQLRREVEHTTLAALRALGLVEGPAHVELRVGPRGPSIIEVNPRLAGGFIPELVRLATGIDLLEANVRLAAGLPVALEPSARRHAAIRFFLPEQSGVLMELCGLAEAARLPNVVEAVGYKASGEAVSLRGDFRDRVGHVITCGADREAVLGAAATACQRVAVRVQAPRSQAVG